MERTKDSYEEHEPGWRFVKACGEYTLKVENDQMDELWLKYLSVRADPEATHTETVAAGNEFVKEFNRLGITAPNSNED